MPAAENDNVLEAMLEAPFEIKVSSAQAKALERAIVKSKVLGSSMLHGDDELAKLLSDLYDQIVDRADKVIKLRDLLEGITVVPQDR